MRRLVLGLVLLGCASPALAPGKGAIEGKVRAAAKAGVHDGARYDEASGGPVRIDYDRLDGIVVWLEGTLPPRGETAKGETIRLTLGSKGFEPRVAAVSSGALLTIENATLEPATVYALSAFDAGTISPGKSVTIAISGDGPCEVLVEERDVRGVLYRAGGPCRGPLRSGDGFRWDGLTPGDYVVHAWHPRLPAASAPVAVAAGGVSASDLTLSVNGLPEAR